MPKTILPDWDLFNEEKNQSRCVITLPGRGCGGLELAEAYYEAGHLGNDVLIVGVTPDNLQWYPPPFGPTNQADAVGGILPAVQAIKRVLHRLQADFGIKAQQTALAGFSAGGVIALHSALRLPVACGVVHNGASLDPSLVAGSKTTPLLLFHNRDDGVFNWENRYLPTKEALTKNNFNARYVEHRTGGHNYSPADLKVASQFILQSLEDGEGN